MTVRDHPREGLLVLRDAVVDARNVFSVGPSRSADLILSDSRSRSARTKARGNVRPEAPDQRGGARSGIR